MARSLASLFVMGVCLITTNARAADLAEFIARPAEDALRDHKLGLAVSLWRGVVAIRGEGDPAVEKLALAWTLAGEPEAAVEELERRRRAVSDAQVIASLDQQIEELGHRAHGFTGSVFQVVPAEAQAKEAFRRGRGSSPPAPSGGSRSEPRSRASRCGSTASRRRWRSRSRTSPSRLEATASSATRRNTTSRATSTSTCPRPETCAPTSPGRSSRTSSIRGAGSSWKTPTTRAK